MKSQNSMDTYITSLYNFSTISKLRGNLKREIYEREVLNFLRFLFQYHLYTVADWGSMDRFVTQTHSRAF